MTTDHDAAARLAPSPPLRASVAGTVARADAAGDRRLPVVGLTRLSMLGWTWLWFCAGLFALLLGLVIGPRVAEDEQQYLCVGNIELMGPFGLALNCDSPQFMWLARQPEGLLEHRNARQSRPGMIAAAALLTRPLSLLVPPGGPPLPVTQGLLETERITVSLARDLPAYLAYILLNCGVLLLCFHFVRQTMAPAGVKDGATLVVLVAMGLLVVGNDVTKAFFWSPHTQLFNVFVPVLALYATLRVVNGAAFDRTFAFGLGLAVGLGVTAYGVFIVVPACLMLPWLWALTREPSRRRRRHALANLALLFALGVAPMALWYFYVVATTGEFFHIEAEHFGQVVWIVEALEQGSFLRRFFMTLGELLAFAAPQALPFAMLAVLLGVAALRDRNAAAGLRATLPIAVIGLYVSVAFLSFYTCVGWYSDRLAYPAIPPLLITAGVAAATMAGRMDPRRRRMLASGCAGVALANLVWLVAKDGPWS
jgi:hypothetical protein